MKCSHCGCEISREKEQSFAEANFGSCFDCEDKPLNFDCLSEHDLCAYLQIPNTNIRDMAALRAQGRPLRAIAEAVRAKGVKISHDGVAGVLKSQRAVQGSPDDLFKIVR